MSFIYLFVGAIFFAISGFYMGVNRTLMFLKTRPVPGCDCSRCNRLREEGRK